MKPAPVLDLEALPVILTLPEMATIFRLAVSTLRRQVQQGTFAPAPWATYPYRWRRQDALAELNRPRSTPPRLSTKELARRMSKEEFVRAMLWKDVLAGELTRDDLRQGSPLPKPRDAKVTRPRLPTARRRR